MGERGVCGGGSVSVPQSVFRPRPEVDEDLPTPLELARGYVAEHGRVNTGTGGFSAPTLGLSSATRSESCIQITISHAHREPESYQWTWKQFDAGHPGTRVPFDRAGLWTPKQIREWTS